MKITLCLVAFFAGLLQVNSQNCLTPNDNRQPNPNGKVGLYTGQQEFSLALLNAINQLNPEENLFFSPYSTYHALLLTYFISSNKTEDFLKGTLKLDRSQDKADVYNAYKLDKFTTQLRSKNSSYEFTNANRIYVDQNLNIRECITQLFLDELQPTDFRTNPDSARQNINKWVETQTHDMIKDLLPPGTIDQSTNLVLVNAAYFKGIWENKFDPEHTKPDVFYINPSKRTFVDMMHVEGTFNHDISEALMAHILELPYQGSDISMYILLPPFVKDDGVASILKSLTLERFQSIVEENSSLLPRTVKVSLPKFSLEHTIEMVPCGMAFHLLNKQNTPTLLRFILTNPVIKANSFRIIQDSNKKIEFLNTRLKKHKTTFGRLKHGAKGTNTFYTHKKRYFSKDKIIGDTRYENRVSDFISGNNLATIFENVQLPIKTKHKIKPNVTNLKGEEQIKNAVTDVVEQFLPLKMEDKRLSKFMRPKSVDWLYREALKNSKKGESKNEAVDNTLLSASRTSVFPAPKPLDKPSEKLIKPLNDIILDKKQVILQQATENLKPKGFSKRVENFLNNHKNEIIEELKPVHSKPQKRNTFKSHYKVKPGSDIAKGEKPWLSYAEYVKKKSVLFTDNDLNNLTIFRKFDKPMPNVRTFATKDYDFNFANKKNKYINENTRNLLKEWNTSPIEAHVRIDNLGFLMEHDAPEPDLDKQELKDQCSKPRKPEEVKWDPEVYDLIHFWNHCGAKKNMRMDNIQYKMVKHGDFTPREEGKGPKSKPSSCNKRCYGTSAPLSTALNQVEDGPSTINIQRPLTSEMKLSSPVLKRPVKRYELKEFDEPRKIRSEPSSPIRADDLNAELLQRDQDFYARTLKKKVLM